MLLICVLRPVSYTHLDVYKRQYEAIVKGQNIPKPGIPESFKVLIKELQSLGLDVKALDKDDQEIDLKQNFDDDDDMGFNHADMNFDEQNVADRCV